MRVSVPRAWVEDGGVANASRPPHARTARQDCHRRSIVEVNGAMRRVTADERSKTVIATAEESSMTRIAGYGLVGDFVELGPERTTEFMHARG